jgi:glycosyltransferase involved in cell wall biosynthesis
VQGGRPGAGSLRIAYLTFDFVEVALAMARALGSHGEVLALVPSRELPEKVPNMPDNVDLVTFEKPRLRQPIKQVRTCLSLVRQIRRFRPDLVHLQQGHLWFNLVLPLLRRYPLVVTIHDHTPHVGDRGGRKTPPRAMRLAFRPADEVIVHAEQVKREVAELRGVPPGIVHTIPHVAIGDLVPPRGLPEDPNLVLFFGRIWPYKGLDYLIRAEPRITARIPDVRFVIAGKGESVDRYVRQMGDPARFLIQNRFVSAEERAELFERAAVIVLPYVEASQSGVVPVAYAFGKPVVATSVGGLPEAVEHERTGLIVPPRDEVRLAEAVAQLLERPGWRHELGARGRRKFETEWSPDAVTRETVRVYEAALERRRARPG